MKIHAGLVLLLFCEFNLGARARAQDHWPVAEPSAQSMNADSLNSLGADIRSGRYGYIDGLIITRNGSIIYDNKYKHDYLSIYSENAAKKSGLNQLDPGGPYNYYSSWWHPYYHQTE